MILFGVFALIGKIFRLVFGLIWWIFKAVLLVIALPALLIGLVFFGYSLSFRRWFPRFW